MAPWILLLHGRQFVTLFLLAGVLLTGLPAQPASRQCLDTDSSLVTDFYLCGDSLCNCTGDVARCKLPSYIPRLPASIKVLMVILSWDLDDNFFANVSEIQTVALTKSGEVGPILFPPDLFSPFRNLTNLTIQGCHVFDQYDIFDIKYALSVPTLLVLTARMINMRFFSESEYSLYGLHSILEILDLSNNNCVDLDVSTFCPLRNLQNLRLNNCGLKRVTYRDNCSLSITSFSLKENQLDRAVYVISPSNSSLYFPELLSLDLTRNNVTTTTWHTFNRNVLPRLQTLNLDHQKPQPIFVPSTDKVVLDIPTLTALSLAGNRGDFSNRRILDSKTFAVCNRLRTLILDENDFLKVDDDRFLELFGHLKELENLSLRSCRLNDFSVKVFTHFPRLAKLDVSSNSLPGIPDGIFDSLRHFRYLDISGNAVSLVTKDTFSLATRERLKQLYLNENPLFCDCHLLWFRDWLLSKRSLFYAANRSAARRTPGTQHYMCKNLPNMSVEKFTTIKQPCIMSREVSTQVVMTCSTILVTMVILLLVISYRWHIRLLLYETFRGRGQARRERLVAGHFDFDVFVSYASEDAVWVHHCLVPHLEDQNGLRLCLHERDFRLGKGIMENIVDCVASSKKIVMVFSRDFVRSPWCQFELTYCLSHVMDYDDALIVLCVDDVTSRDMTAAMIAVMKTTTCIEWQENEDAMAAFWGRLRLALAEIYEFHDRRV